MNYLMNYRRIDGNKRNLTIWGLLLISAFFAAGCATTVPPSYPENPEARKHYDLGALFMQTEQYEMAIKEFQTSLQLDPEPFLTHAKLATAFYAQQKFNHAAEKFEEAYVLWEGPGNAPAYAILQVLCLLRGGEMEQAEKLLRSWSGPSIATSLGQAYSVGSGKLPSGWWKEVAKYLLSDVNEERVLENAKTEISFAYLIIGVNSIVKGDIEKAEKYLPMVMDIAGQSTMRFALAKSEINNIGK